MQIDTHFVVVITPTKDRSGIPSAEFLHEVLSGRQG